MANQMVLESCHGLKDIHITESSNKVKRTGKVSKFGLMQQSMRENGEMD